MASDLAGTLGADGTVQAAEPWLRTVRDRIKQAREYRKQFEPTWHSNLAFAAGKHWLVWDRQTRTLRRIQDMNPAYKGRELYSSDIVTEYRTTALGELGSDDDRPELLLIRDDRWSEEYQSAANRAVEYGWENEWQGDEILAECDRLTLDLGTSAIRCRFDPTVGKAAGELPHVDGKPIHKIEEQAQLADQFQQGMIQNVEMREVKQGRITWEALSAFNILVPPGVNHEKNFPWEVIVRPTPLDTVQTEYGDVAMGLKEDGDIASVMGLSTDSQNIDALSYMTTDARQNRLRDHVWLFTYYERPTSKYPQGRTVVLAGNEMKLLHEDPSLPYAGPDEEPRSGITYFHWWRTTGRFYSRALVESMKDGQRWLDIIRTQQKEVIDRGMPAVFVEKSSNALKRKGLPLELIELDPQERAPQIVPGIGPGQWMNEMVQQIRDDIERATGIRGPRLGENPANVTTYSQLALVNENEQIKRQQIHQERKTAIKHLVENSLYDIRTYWGRDKTIALAGDEGQAEAEVFDATRLPPFFIVRVARGAAKPRSQAAELKKIEDIYNAAINGAQPLPVRWLYESIKAGQALELPEQTANDQLDKAQHENHLLMQGQPVDPQYYDPPEIHIPVHRGAQIQAELSGNVQAWQTIEDHIQHTLQLAQQNAEQMGQALGADQGAPQEPQQDPAQAEADAQKQEIERQKAEADQMRMMAQEQRAQEMHYEQLRKLSAEADLAEKVAKQGGQKTEKKSDAKKEKPAPAPEVHVHPNIHVNVPERKEGSKEITFKRGEDNRIESAEVTEGKKKKRG